MPSWGELYDRRMEIVEFHLAGQHDQSTHGRGGGGSRAASGAGIPKKDDISPKLKKALIGLAAVGAIGAGILAAPFISKELGRRRDQAKGALIKNQVGKAIKPMEDSYDSRHQADANKRIAYNAGYLLGKMRKNKKAGKSRFDAIASIAVEDAAVSKGRRIKAASAEEVGRALREGRLGDLSSESVEFATDELSGFTKAEMLKILADIETVIVEMEPPEDVVEELRTFQAVLISRIDSLK